MSRYTVDVGSLSNIQSDLRSNHNIVTVVLQKFADDFFGSSIRVNIRRIIEVHSEVKGSFHYRLRLIDLNHPFFRITEGHCSGTYARHLETRGPKTRILH